MEKESKSSQAYEDLGLSERMKFDVQKSPRPETSEATQRPLADKTSIKSDRGMFQTK